VTIVKAIDDLQGMVKDICRLISIASLSPTVLSKSLCLNGVKKYTWNSEVNDFGCLKDINPVIYSRDY